MAMKKKVRKTASKPAALAKKTAARKPAKRAAKAAAPKGPTPVKIGRGPTPRQIGQAVVEHFNRGGADRELWDKYWHPGAESIEGEGMAMSWRGRKAIQAKGEWWSANNTVHSARAEGPFVGATGFSIRFRMDTQDKSTGKRTNHDEIGVYTIQNGKVVREEFMYGKSGALDEPRSQGSTIVSEPRVLETIGA